MRRKMATVGHGAPLYNSFRCMGAAEKQTPARQRAAAGEQLPISGRRQLDDDQSSGSTFTIEAPWLLPTQNVGGVGGLAPNAPRRVGVGGRRYSPPRPGFGPS